MLLKNTELMSIAGGIIYLASNVRSLLRIGFVIPNRSCNSLYTTQ